MSCDNCHYVDGRFKPCNDHSPEAADGFKWKLEDARRELQSVRDELKRIRSYEPDPEREDIKAQLAARDHELQLAAAENAVMREAATRLRDKGDHADFCEWDQVDENDGCPISCSCGHNDVIAALSTPSPRAAQILAALDAARLAYAVPNPTATGADLEALTDLGRKLAALVRP